MPDKTKIEVTDFDPAGISPIYDELAPSWEMNRDFAEMHLHILRGGAYLDTFGDKIKEADASYAWRAQASFAMDHCADLINLRVDNLFRSPPVREYEKSPHKKFIEGFLADVDGGGTSMDAFMRRALVAYYVNGVDIVVDKAAPPGGAVANTRADEQSLELMPYLHAFGPLERLDWACDHGGSYLWARYDLGQDPDPDERGGGSGAHKYLTMLRREWRLYEVRSEGEGDQEKRTILMSSGPIALGACPVVPLYFKTSGRADYPQVPLSLLTRIAPIARYMLNLLSQSQLDLYASVAFFALLGIEEKDAPDTISPMTIWCLPGEHAAVQQLGREIGPIKEKREWLAMLMEAILRIGKLTGGTGDLESRASSGVQVAVERTDLDNEMRMTAGQAEDAERRIVQFAVSRWQGKFIEADAIGYGVEYNRKYVLTPVTELIKQAREFFGIGVHDEVQGLAKILLGKILDASLSDQDARYNEALEEIKAATLDGLAGAEPVGESEGRTQSGEPEIEEE